jgi:hypothetical protein
MRHRFGKGVAGLLAGLIAICLLSLPTAANTATVQFIHSTTGTPGSINVFNADEELVASIPLGSTTTPTCSTGSGGFSVSVTGTLTTVSGGGTITVIFNNHCRAFAIGTVRWCSSMTGTFSGTWAHITGSAKTYTSSNTVFTIVLRKDHATAPTHNCHSVSSTSCTIFAGPVTVNGSITSTTIPTLAISDTVTVNGGSVVESLTVVGTGVDCGQFLGANNGYLTVSSYGHVTSVP